jgi:DNA-binding FadR family transcriptional regulator
VRDLHADPPVAISRKHTYTQVLCQGFSVTPTDVDHRGFASSNLNYMRESVRPLDASSSEELSSRWSAVFRPLGGARPSEIIVARIRSAISLGLLTDSDPFPLEPEMARLFDTTPFAVREALSVLREQGLVETKRGRGGGSSVRVPTGQPSVVSLRQLAVLSTAEVRDIGDWRALLISGAAELAVRRASQQHVRRLRDYATRLHVSATTNDARKAHSRFHFELAAAAQSVRLNSAELALQTELGWLFALTLEDADVRTALAALLLNFVDALGERQGPQAMEIVSVISGLMTTALIQLRLSLSDRGES